MLRSNVSGWTFSIVVLSINIVAYVLIWHFSVLSDGNCEHAVPADLTVPVLNNMRALEAYEYRRIAPTRISNSGGGELTHCSASNLPRDLKVRVSDDRATCELIGIPDQSRNSVEVLIVALNAAGSSSIQLPVTVYRRTLN